jgi:hypothetical protein
MVNESVRTFVEAIGYAFVATTDQAGNPHLAAGTGITFPEPNLLVFESWFCDTTLKNLLENPRIAVAVVDPLTGKGYQFLGRVEKKQGAAYLNGFLPETEPPGLPQVQWRLEARVDTVLAFTHEAHSDRPLG